MTSTTTSRPVPSTSTPSTSRSWIERAAGAWSGLVAAVGVWWLAVPDAYPGHLEQPETHGSLVALLDPTVVSSLLVLVGLIGALATAASRWLVPLGVSHAVLFGLIATDLSLLVTMGYSAAILGPPILFGYLVVASVRRPSLRWVVGGVAAAAVAGAAASGAGPSAFADFGRGLGEGLERSGVTMLVSLVSFVGGVLWLMVTLRATGMRRGQLAPAPYVVPRRNWGWWATVVAALCPLPYAVARMTWLTPWPTIIDADTLAEQPAMRIFGLSLGFAAIGGAVLTIGLLMRWGSVYPRWIPIVAGRSVSPVWPTVVAVIVGSAVTVAGRSMLQMTFTDDSLMSKVETLLLLPFPLWGPLLIAAAIAYYRRRTASA